MIKGCIFDLGGVLVDKYSLITKNTLKDVFYQKNIVLTDKIIQKNININKFKQISDIFKDKYVINKWKYKYNCIPNFNDKIKLYQKYNKLIFNNINNYMEIIPETYDCLKYLKNNNIKIGIISGFSPNIINNIINKFNLNEYIDANISIIYYDNILVTLNDKDDFNNSKLHGVKNIMKQMNINNPRYIIKIDDTFNGLNDIKNIDCFKVGVSRWSVNMNINNINESYLIDNINKINNFDEYYNYCIFKEKITKSNKILLKSKPDNVINTLNDLPEIIQKIDKNNLLNAYTTIKNNKIII